MEQTQKTMRPRVLLVDDDRDLLSVVRMAAAAASFDLDIAEDSDEALRFYRTARYGGHPYAGLILDGMMPGLSGYALATRIRETDHETPLAFLSAHASDLWRHWAAELNVTAFWEKPLDPGRMVESIEEWLNRAKVNIE